MIALAAGVVPMVVAGCSSHGSASKASSAAPAQGATNRPSAGSAAPSTPPPVDLAVAKRPASDRQVISTAELDLQARATSTARSIARSAVVDDAGGYVFSETASLTSARHAHVVFKVPPERFADVIARIGRLGTLVHRQIGTDDVTGRVVDLGARLQAARTSAERLRELLANSAGVADLLNVENQLTTRESQVDSLAGELAALRGQVDMATVTLDVDPTPTSTRGGPGGREAGVPARPAGGSRCLRRHRPRGGGDPRDPAAVPADRVLAGAFVWWIVRRRAAAKVPAS